MKKKIFILLSFISTASLAQVKQDTVIIKKDSVKVTPFVISEDKTPKKRKKNIEKETVPNYAEEYKRDNVKFQWGLRGGINFGSFNTKETSAVIVTSSGTPLLENNRIIKHQLLSNKEMVLGYLGGLFFRLNRGSFFFQPEAIYTKKGGKIDILQSDGKLYRRVNASYSAIDIPLLLGIRFRKGRVFAGPMFEFPINFNSELEDAVKIYSAKDFKKELFTRPSFGVSAGIGFEFTHFFIEGRYETALGNAVDYEIGPASNPSKLQIIPHALTLSIGIIR